MKFHTIIDNVKVYVSLCIEIELIFYFSDLQPSSNVLTVQSIDFCISENGNSHHTSKFDVMKQEKNPGLVVRRGQSFLLDITFHRQFNTSTDAVSFIFTVAGNFSIVNYYTYKIYGMLTCYYFFRC